MKQGEDEKELLTLSNVYVMYYNNGKSGRYKTESIAIDLFSSPEMQYLCNKIDQWYEDNHIGNSKPKYNCGLKKDRLLVNFKLGPYTEIRDIHGNILDRDILGNDMIVSFVAKAVPYHNEYGEGITHYIQYLEVHNPEKSSAKKYHDMIVQEDMATRPYSNDNKIEEVPSSENNPENENTQAENDNEIDPTMLDDVPF